MFELRADEEGPRSISITAWLDGSYLGELLVEVTADRSQVGGVQREFREEIDTEASEGAVSLVVRYDPDLRAYRFRVPRRGQSGRGGEQAVLRAAPAD